MVCQDLLAGLLKVNLEVGYGVSGYAREVHPIEVVLVKAADLVLERLEVVWPVFLIWLLAGLLPEPVVLAAGELETKPEECALVVVNQLPLVEGATHPTLVLTSSSVPTLGGPKAP
jgi:hypothetical protein